MLLDRRAMRDLARASILERPLTLRRARYLASFSSLYFTVRSFMNVARAVDDVLYPDWRSVRVEKPFFIFATPRSGTTLLQYLMSLDEERFSCFKLWQTIFPTVSVNRLAEAIERLDGALGNPVARIVSRTNEHYFGRWEGVHNMGLERLEEDEAVFVMTLNAPGLILMFPDVPRLLRVNATDRLEPEWRRKVMDYYEDVLKRHLYATGPEKTILNKNVFTPSRVRSIRDKFEDARFIYLVRHPYDAIASCINLFYVPWTAHSPEIPMISPETSRVVEWAIEYYRTALSFRDEMPPAQMLVHKFETLARQPVETVERIYAHFGLEMGASFRRRLVEVARERRTDEFKSARKYTLEDWGASREHIYRELRDVFDEYGYEP
jgi:hypothetical protein